MISLGFIAAFVFGIFANRYGVIDIQVAGETVQEYLATQKFLKMAVLAATILAIGAVVLELLSFVLEVAS